MKTFKSKIDLWLTLALIFCIAVSLFGAWDLIVNQASNKHFALAFCLLVIGAGLPVWLILGTKYTVDKDELKIVSGPFSWKIAIASIDQIKTSHSFISSPALSLDRLEIKYRGNQSILISPKDKDAFLAAINHPIS